MKTFAMPVTEKRNKEEWIASFMSGEISLMSLPAWVLGGKQCKDVNYHGRCNEAVYGEGDYCHYHKHCDLDYYYH